MSHRIDHPKPGKEIPSRWFVAYGDAPGEVPGPLTALVFPWDGNRPVDVKITMISQAPIWAVKVGKLKKGRYDLCLYEADSKGRPIKWHDTFPFAVGREPEPPIAPEIYHPLEDAEVQSSYFLSYGTIGAPALVNGGMLFRDQAETQVITATCTVYPQEEEDWIVQFKNANVSVRTTAYMKILSTSEPQTQRITLLAPTQTELESVKAPAAARSPTS